MNQSNPVKLRLVSGSLQFEYEGSEAFLQTEALKIVQEIYDLQRSTLSISANILQNTIQEAQSVQAALAEAAAALRSDLDTMSELNEMDQMRLQMAMDRESKFISSLSNILKKISATAESITQNLE